MELLDTPGILWPKFDDQEIGKKLALIGSIRDEITDAQELAVWLIRYLEKEYPDVLENRYQLSQIEDKADVTAIFGIARDQEVDQAVKTLGQIALRRGCLKAGGEADPEKAAKTLIDDFRSGRLGTITLEKV